MVGLMDSGETAAPLFEVAGVKVAFGTGSKRVEALKGVSLTLAAGSTVGLVGESGSGKTTLARTLVGLQPIDAGELRLAGQSLVGLRPRQWRPLRRRFQMVFQDPVRSLNPRLSIRGLLEEPLRIHFPKQTRAARDARIAALLAQVGLGEVSPERSPRDLSGGQRQRIGIARALAVEPEWLLLDEPVSALDVSVQAQILDLLLDLREALGLGWLFIGHDLAVIEQVCEAVHVMQHGSIVESGPVAEVFQNPRHPYTQRLLAAARAGSTPAA